MDVSTATLRIVEPCPGLYAYYDGRIEGRRLYADTPNWLDDGAYVLGIASYAIVDAGEALVYDTHMSLPHAQAVRSHLASLGVATPRVALSHWHCDHVAGNAVFDDCEIIALRLTAETMAANRADLETRDPPIRPLIMPNRLFDTRLDLTVGDRAVQLHHFDIHSRDGVVAWLPDDGVLLAGDTLEDTVTYVTEPAAIATHIRELGRLRGWPIRRILPNHGAFGRIAAGGYEPSLIDANQRYLAWLADGAPGEPAAALAEVIAPDEAAGAVSFFAPYEAVHRNNMAALQAARHGAGGAAPA